MRIQKTFEPKIQNSNFCKNCYFLGLLAERVELFYICKLLGLDGQSLLSLDFSYDFKLLGFRISSNVSTPNCDDDIQAQKLEI